MKDLEKINRIERIVTDHEGVDIVSILAGERSLEVLKARQLVWYILVEAGMSESEAGKMYSLTIRTVQRAINAVKKLKDKSCEYRWNLEAIKSKIESENQ
jgi:chromosomal replication initiation ATPase DnaA